MDDQVALMEKSYELAAKYMGGQNGTQPPVGQAAEPYPVQKAGKNTAAPVRQVTHQVVSSLSQPMSNAEFVASFSQERNRSFNTAVGVTTVSDRNTISACVYGAQSVTDGQAVRLRLLEPMAVADKIIPRNAVVVGTAKIQGERLDIEITSLEYAGTIIPVELAVYDTADLRKRTGYTFPVDPNSVYPFRGAEVCSGRLLCDRGTCDCVAGRRTVGK